MKIVVRDSQQSTLGSISINIRDIGNGLEKIAVKSLSAVSRTRVERTGTRWADSATRSRSDLAPSGRATVASPVRREVADVPARRPARADHTRPIARTPVSSSSAELQPTATSNAKRTGREIKITLPTLKIPQILSKPVRQLSGWAGRYVLKPLKRQFVKLPGKARVAVSACVVILLLVGAHGLFAGGDQPEVKAAASKRQSLTRGTPDYATVLPAGKTIDDLGGWIRVSPPNRNAVYAYADKVGGVRVDVSEQPLPPALKNNTPEQMARLAQSYAANGTLTAGGTTVYIGTSAKGPQSLILSQKNLLILIKSASPLADKQWVAYINSLR